MNYPDAAADPWCCYNNNSGEAAAAAVPTSGEASTFFADMVAADYSTDDLFELVLEQEGREGGGASGSMQPALSCLRSARLSRPSDVRFDPPSEDEMAAWLRTIVEGDERNDDDGGRLPMADGGREDVVPVVMGTSIATIENKEKVPTKAAAEGMTLMGNKEKIRKAPAGGPSRRSHHGEAHNLTEKRRRHKINERLKTLQQIVPGCSKGSETGCADMATSMADSELTAIYYLKKSQLAWSNQASTLDQTIHYMKSLQHQVQAMSSAGLAAAYPAVVQPRCVPLGTTPVSSSMPFHAAAPMVLGGHHPPSPTTMVPFGTTTMLQLLHYPAAAAVMVPLYPAAAHACTAVTPRDAVSTNRLRGRCI